MQYTNIIRDFLPQLERNYQQIYDPREPRAVQQVVESLVLLEQEAEKTKAAIIDHNVMELENHARLLKLQYGKFDDGLMPDQGHQES